MHILKKTHSQIHIWACIYIQVYVHRIKNKNKEADFAKISTARV